MDFGLAFSYVFKDPDWFKKIGIIALVSLIPIIGQIVLLGWALQITKRVMIKNPDVLPEMDFAEDLKHGFMAFVISFVYTLPITAVAGILGIIDATLGVSSNQDSLWTVLSIVSICFGFFAIIYGILVSLVLPAAFANYLEKDQLSAGFALKEVFGLVRANPGAYVLVFLGMILTGLIAPIGAIACIIGAVLTAAYGQAVMGHLYGQAYNAAKPAPVEVITP
jgi:hypothetical protein